MPQRRTPEDEEKERTKLAKRAEATERMKEWRQKRTYEQIEMNQEANRKRMAEKRALGRSSAAGREKQKALNEANRKRQALKRKKDRELRAMGLGPDGHLLQPNKASRDARYVTSDAMPTPVVRTVVVATPWTS
jgi:hypothetical protein